ncbi:MAG: penicillin-binding transpeptidase domain-containing protein [Lachnospiraceae bacterium]|nr:penicillin-binding transpeptidase domain-containing protein [Lachnospiraceae bacterium]
MGRRRKSYGRVGRRRQNQTWKIALLVVLVVLLAGVVVAAAVLLRGNGTESGTKESGTAESTEAEIFADSPAGALTSYFALIEAADYTGMYEMLDADSQETVSEEDFVTRNQNIYEGIGAAEITVEVASVTEETEESSEKSTESDAAGTSVSYTVTMNTVAGSLSYDNTTTFVQENAEWKVVWSDSMIFPDLTSTDSVKVSTESAARGSIYDRDGELLAVTGSASSVGLLPGKMDDDSVAQLADVLGISEETIENKLSASWVTDDSFVPVATVEKLTEQEQMTDDLSEETKEKQERDEALLAIAGVKITDTEVRTYPLGEAAAHLVGYVQSITAEELDEDTENVYTSTSLIGKTGLESLYEERLRGTPGRKIRIVSENGDTKKILAISNAKDGEDITVTIDADLQELLYEQYQDDESATVAMNPYTGEVLALLSTPSYDTNTFILGLSQDQWDAWNDDEATPLVNRFRSVWTPGSTFKTVTAAIGLTTGALDAETDYGCEGDSWQYDDSWGSYSVTTLHAADPATVQNALVLSDNVFFARAAMTIGQEALTSAWDSLGFGEELPFDIKMTVSTYDNDGEITSDIQLADSGYGQGEIQINILHLAMIYSSFLNQGDILTPSLEKTDETETTVWKEGVFSEEACEFINEALTQVVEDSNGTGHKAQIDGLALAGKTGTAEIKSSQSDTSGTELGWFAAYTTELSEEDSLLVVTMVEDVKDIGGSGYVVEKSKTIFEEYCLTGEEETETSEETTEEEE